MTKKELEEENRILRLTIDPHVLESLICDGDIDAGIGIPCWNSKYSKSNCYGLDNLISNIEVGNNSLHPRLEKWLSKNKPKILRKLYQKLTLLKFEN